MTSSKPVALYVTLLKTNIAEYLRDPLPNIFTFIMPLLFMVIFAVSALLTGNTGNATPRVWQFGYVDQARTPRSEQLRAALESLSSLRLLDLTPQAAERAYNHNDIQAVIRTSPGWNGFDTAGLEITFQPLAKDQVEDVMAAADGRLSVLATGASAEFSPARHVRYEERRTTIPSFLQFTITGLLGFGLLNMGLYGTATPLLTSKQMGVFRQYSLTPMPISMLLLAHVTVRVIMALLQVGLLTAGAILLAGLKLQANPLLLLWTAIFSAAALISVGYLIGGSLRRISTGIAVVFGLNFFFALFGQTFADLRGVPVAKFLIYASPLTYASDAFRQIFVGPETRLLPLPADLVVLGGCTIFCMAICLKTFTFESRSR